MFGSWYMSKIRNVCFSGLQVRSFEAAQPRACFSLP